MTEERTIIIETNQVYFDAQTKKEAIKAGKNVISQMHGFCPSCLLKLL